MLACEHMSVLAAATHDVPQWAHPVTVRIVCVRLRCPSQVEASSARHGIGLVKLMGRQSGFIAMQASMASGDRGWVHLMFLSPTTTLCTRHHTIMQRAIKSCHFTYLVQHKSREPG